MLADVLTILGAVIIVVGVADYFGPAIAFIVAGLLMFLAAQRLGR